MIGAGAAIPAIAVVSVLVVGTLVRGRARPVVLGNSVAFKAIY
jgi:hypothetical protein